MCRKWTGLPRLLLARSRSISAHALWSRDRSVRMRCDMTLSHGLNWPIFDQWEHRTTKTNPNYRHEVIDGVLFKMDRRSEFRVWKKLSHKIFFLFFLMFQIKTSHSNTVTCRICATSDFSAISDPYTDGGLDNYPATRLDIFKFNDLSSRFSLCIQKYATFSKMIGCWFPCLSKTRQGNTCTPPFCEIVKPAFNA